MARKKNKKRVYCLAWSPPKAWGPPIKAGDELSSDLGTHVFGTLGLFSYCFSVTSNDGPRYF